MYDTVKSITTVFESLRSDNPDWPAIAAVASAGPWRRDAVMTAILDPTLTLTDYLVVAVNRPEQRARDIIGHTLTHVITHQNELTAGERARMLDAADQLEQTNDDKPMIHAVSALLRTAGGDDNGAIRLAGRALAADPTIRLAVLVITLIDAKR